MKVITTSVMLWRGSQRIVKEEAWWRRRTLLVKDVDFIFICTSPMISIGPDIQLCEVIDGNISKHLSRDTMVVSPSPSYPGTTEELLLPILERGSGLKKCGRRFLSRILSRHWSEQSDIQDQNTPKVVGAVGKDATEVISAMYRGSFEGEIYNYLHRQSLRWRRYWENTCKHQYRSRNGHAARWAHLGR